VRKRGDEKKEATHERRQVEDPFQGKNLAGTAPVAGIV
jgi:hypothetical protein